MQSQEIQKTIEAIRQHILAALGYLYEATDVGDNPLELGEHSITYSDGAEYLITGIEMMFDENPKGEMVFHQIEEGNGESATYPVTNLSLDSLKELLEAAETVVGAYYDQPLEFPVIIDAEPLNENPIIDATYVSVWDDGLEMRSKCKYDPVILNVTDIQSADLQGLEVLEREYLVLSDGKTLERDEFTINFDCD